ncbi:MAG TPA: cysteine--tRNA ligase [Gammaproteobacteria bacterium]|nr:cysteine--tRNA ligase [Gammaproteobacteria bacterium]HAT25979.1 cysteine--tRNA ligase [Gammaproteobacteria bacterium]
MIKIYNTLTQTKEEFKPLEEAKVRIYVCGITTYDYCHLGHARMLVAFDMVVRHLRVRGYEVTYVRNITDIDDKILSRARENGEVFSDLTERFITAMHADERALSILPPDQEPRATAHIDEIIAMIEKLIATDFAYRAGNGDVYFSVTQFPDYGKLSKKKLDELLDGARIEVGELKRDPRDFALWKASADDDVGWDSPWGYGRPGWHIECSAMSTCSLGDTFDIHGGGSDLMFPHHENEIAQSEAATGCTFAKLWMHNGPLRVDNEKMSKSLNNFFTVREVLKEYDGEVVRQLLIASHYRSPINYSPQSLQQAAKVLKRLYTALKDLDVANAKSLTNSRFEKAFLAAMDDDFNTPKAFAVLFDMVKEINRQKSADMESASQLGALLVKLGGHLGLLQSQPQDFLRGEVNPQQVEQLIAAREQARADKDWARADQIRDQLSAMQVVVEDGADGSSWRLDR